MKKYFYLDEKGNKIPLELSYEMPDEMVFENIPSLINHTIISTESFFESVTMLVCNAEMTILDAIECQYDMMNRQDAPWKFDMEFTDDLCKEFMEWCEICVTCADKDLVVYEHFLGTNPKTIEEARAILHNKK